MLKISQRQMVALGSAVAGEFERRMVSRLETLLPRVSTAQSPERLHELVRGGIERAASCGITSEKQVSRFLGLMCALGERFDAELDRLFGGGEGATRILEKLDGLSRAADEHLSAPRDAGAGSERRSEAAAALAASSRAACEDPAAGRIDVGQPDAPCLTLRRRNLMFSA